MLVDSRLCSSFHLFVVNLDVAYIHAYQIGEIHQIKDIIYSLSIPSIQYQLNRANFVVIYYFIQFNVPCNKLLVSEIA